MTVPAWFLIPKDLGPHEKRPGILAAHGHGNGKDDIVGVTREKEMAKEKRLIKQLNMNTPWMPFGADTWSLLRAGARWGSIPRRPTGSARRRATSAM